MTGPVNIYRLSRIRGREAFNIIERHSTHYLEPKRTQEHEMESLRLLADEFMRNGVTVSEMDGFFYSFHIPHIGKEFDLIKFTAKACLNIELKSSPVSKEQIADQLRKNRYYLGHLGKRILLYTVVTGTMSCYKLSLNDELVPVKVSEVVKAVRMVADGFEESIDNLFRASDYLVSPINTPNRFIQGEYFLTQAQALIKKNILNDTDAALGCAFFHLTGKPGTGKTLLLYDLAKTLARTGNTLLVHCGKLGKGHERIAKEISQLDIIASADVKAPLSKYNYILVDEAHRMLPEEYEAVVDSVRKNNQICVWSTDPEQVLTTTEKKNDITGRIQTLPPDEEYTLSEKIRTNAEMSSFITCLRNLKQKSKHKSEYADVELDYANSTQEAQYLLEYYRSREYVFINYTKPEYGENPYAAYEEDFDTHHVIGQEFDKVVMLMDASFYYDADGMLQGIPHPDPDYLYPNLFYQGVTRVREKLALIVVNAPELFGKIATILKN